MRQPSIRFLWGLAVLALVGDCAFSTATARTIRVERPVASEWDGESRVESSRALTPVCAESVLDSIRYTLCVSNSTFEFGQPVQMQYEITNERSEPAEFHFHSSCQEFFSITPNPCPDGCGNVWPVSPGCLQIGSSLPLAPGETRSFVAEWRQHRQDGWRTRPGSFLARAELFEHEYSALEVPFELVSSGPEPIQDALDLATDGDTVLVASGTYFENLLLLAPQRGVVLRSASGPEATILDGGARGSVLYLGQLDNQTIVEGFTITNGRQADDPTVAKYLGGGASIFSSVTMRGNHFRDNESDYGGGIAVEYIASAVLEDNLFLRNMAHREGGGIYSYGNTLVERSTFARNSARRGGGVFDGGILGKRVRSLNCVFYANEASLSGGAVFCHDHPMPTGTYCHVYWENVPDDRAHCVPSNFQFTVDPKFCAADSDDYRPQDSSPLTEENSPCGRIGAFEPGCATTDVVGGNSVESALQVFPNPFHDGLEISARSGAAQIERVEILDASGRQIWSWRARFGAAVPIVRWDGEDHAGNDAPAGVYFVRTWPKLGAVETSPIVRVR